MPSDLLHITLIQPDIVWEDKDANRKQYESYINTAPPRQVVILPEMFSTGFSMDPGKLAEPMDGPTIQWMAEMAAKKGIILTGSLIIEEQETYYNRLIWMQPDGKYALYDKRHLFAYGGEDRYYSGGNKKLIVSVGGWKICLLICYDLRFPVWARNQPDAPYDALVYIANWPERRSLAWKTLLQARAVENQCYVIGVNRVGTDGMDIYYSGDSSVFDPMGEQLWQCSEVACARSMTLDRNRLISVRTELPFLKDADSFLLL